MTKPKLRTFDALQVLCEHADSVNVVWRTIPLDRILAISACWPFHWVEADPAAELTFTDGISVATYHTLLDVAELLGCDNIETLAPKYGGDDDYYSKPIDWEALGKRREEDAG